MTILKERMGHNASLTQMKDKRLVTIQDISCFGKCSLTVALPVISAMGIETAVIPTAVLSTHTGGFSGFTFCDLTEEIPAVSKHWKSIDLKFDAIYTGYLGSKKQLEYVSDFFETFKRENTLIFIDPVMADHGKLYAGFTMDFVKDMAKLCSKADVIVPNLTEATMMLGREYIEFGYDEAYIKELLRDLASLGAKKVILTGVRFNDKELGVACYDSETGEYSFYFKKFINKIFHGTGDVFASACVGALVNGKSLTEAVKMATDFTVESMMNTIDDDDHWYGVKFEKALPMLFK